MPFSLYKEELVPPDQMLLATKKLIDFAVEKEYLSNDYKLYGHKQVRSTSCPGPALYAEIQKWPHFSTNVTEVQVPQIVATQSPQTQSPVIQTSRTQVLQSQSPRTQTIQMQIRSSRPQTIQILSQSPQTRMKKLYLAASKLISFNNNNNYDD